jgi:spoIIIJ-associated protein
MSSFKFEGKNIDKAVKKASEELNLAVDEINYEIISRGSTGIFGLAGAKKAKILVHLPEKPKKVVADVETEGLKSEISVDGRVSEEKSSIDEDLCSRQLYSFDNSPLELGRQVLQRIVNSITTDAEIAVEENSDRIFLNVAGGNAALLIGKKGQTLEAIQSIVEKIINKHNNGDHKIWVQVDVEGYLETRKANLERLAARLAEKSKRIRKPISLGQMRAYDRRIVHMALKSDPDVRTKSRGEGNLRKLVIFPKKNSAHHPRSD